MRGPERVAVALVQGVDLWGKGSSREASEETPRSLFYLYALPCIFIQHHHM